MKLKDLRQKYNGLLQKFIRLFSLSGVAFVLTACYGCPYAEYDVEGRVYDENGNPLENMQAIYNYFAARLLSSLTWSLLRWLSKSNKPWR